jgi:tRNA-specific adenosine deaminase 3
VLRGRNPSQTCQQSIEVNPIVTILTCSDDCSSIIKPIFPTDRSLSLTHLRRVVSLSHLPLDLKWRRDYDGNGLQTVFLLLPNSTVPWYKIAETFAAHVDEPGLPRCFNQVVPRHAPLTIEQANLWSERYWPTSFNPAAQLLQDAPPLNQLRRTQAELDTPSAAEFLQMARNAGEEARLKGYGRGAGAVVVNPKTQQVVAVAGDARWWTDEKTTSANPDLSDAEGRSEHHCLMRVVAMVANKELRRRLRAGSHTRFASTCTESPAGEPLTNIENVYSEAVNSPLVLSPVSSNPASPTLASTSMSTSMAMSPLFPAPNSPTTSNENLAASISSSLSSLSLKSFASKSEGYLCSGLDLYLTHEPCVCCAMAMIHSRFRACIFEKRMPGSGALTARDHPQSLGYGLFWRRELNWRVTTFHYQEKKNQRRKGKGVDKFHA